MADGGAYYSTEEIGRAGGAAGIYGIVCAKQGKFPSVLQALKTAYAFLRSIQSMGYDNAASQGKPSVLFLSFVKPFMLSFCYRIPESLSHRHFAERPDLGSSPTWAISAIMDLRKGWSVMALKYTEEQLESIDRTFQLVLEQVAT